jgi:serine/threonine protein kinase
MNKPSLDQTNNYEYTELSKPSKWKKRISLPFKLKQKVEPPIEVVEKVPTYAFLENMLSSKLTQNYTLSRTELGKGVSGTVFLVKRNKDSELMAAKFTSKIITKGRKDTMQRQLNRTANEVLLLQRLHHENVVKTVDLVTHNNNLAIVMEYCPTNLFNLVKNHTLSKAALHDYFTQIATGVAYLHNEVGIAHRDLKLENVCVGLDGRVKIIDFGSAVHFATTFPGDSPRTKIRPMTMTTNPRYSTSSRTSNIVRTNSSTSDESMESQNSNSSGSASVSHSNTKFHLGKLSIRGLCGSDPYIAPEVWTSNDPLHPSYNLGYDPRLADIWSMGIILTAMHTGRFPWACTKETDQDFISYAYSPLIYLNQFTIPREKFILISYLLEVDLNFRPLIDQVMEYLI